MFVVHKNIPMPTSNTIFLGREKELVVPLEEVIEAVVILPDSMLVKKEK